MTQTDAPLDDKVTLALHGSPHLAGRNLRFERSDGCVTLRGVVRSYFQKQMAQEALKDLDGVDQVFNELEVLSR